MLWHRTYLYGLINRSPVFSSLLSAYAQEGIGQQCNNRQSVSPAALFYRVSQA